MEENNNVETKVIQVDIESEMKKSYIEWRGRGSFGVLGGPPDPGPEAGGGGDA